MAGGWRVEWNGDEIAEQIHEAAADELETIGQEILAKSEELCPKDRGYDGGLVSTAFIEIDKETLSVKIGYTDPNAKRQHEDRRLNHDNGEQAKFLEQPIMQNAQRNFQRIADAIRAKVGR